MNSPPGVTVYCSSARDVARVYFEAAAELGAALAARGWTLVYGGNDLGCMGALANAARANGGVVVGVTPQILVDEGVADAKCHELIVTPNMRERKAVMEVRGDAFVTLPGGLGTLEEVFEILVGRVLGCHDKPVVLLNVEGFYDPLMALLKQGVGQRFIRPKALDHLRVCATVGQTIDFLRQNPPFTERPSPAHS